MIGKYVTVLFLMVMMINIFFWNCRGAASKGIAVVIRDMRKRYCIDVIVILEPTISGSLANKVIRAWGFKNSRRVEVEGFSGEGGFGYYGKEMI